MNVEIGAEAAQFPEKEYISGIAVAVHYINLMSQSLTTFSLRLKKQVTLPSFNALILYNKTSKKITSVHPENPGEQKMRAANWPLRSKGYIGTCRCTETSKLSYFDSKLVC